MGRSQGAQLLSGAPACTPISCDQCWLQPKTTLTVAGAGQQGSHLGPPVRSSSGLLSQLLSQEVIPFYRENNRRLKR